jgi:hypothetical protein
VERNSEWHFTNQARVFLQEQLLRDPDLHKRVHGLLLSIDTSDVSGNEKREIPAYLVLNFANTLTYYLDSHLVSDTILLPAKEGRYAKKEPVPYSIDAKRKTRTDTSCGKIYVTVFCCAACEDDLDGRTGNG